MTDEIRAPWTEQQVAALNAWQRSGRGNPFTCRAFHLMRQTLIAELDGWHCPDEECGYSQSWAHAWMATPAALDPPGLPGVVEQLAVLQAIAQPTLAAELKRTQELLRITEEQLGVERRRTADLGRRLAFAEGRVQALEVHEAQRRIALVDVPCGEILHGQTITDVPTGDVL